MKSGIYKITCIENGKVYIGQSKDVKNRFKVHMYELKTGKHGNPYFKRAYEKYGRDSFKFEVLEFCELEKLDEREIFYFQLFRSCEEEYGYNILSDSSWSIALKKRWSDPEFKKQVINKAKERWKNDEKFKERNILGIRKAHEERKARGETLGCLSEEGKRKSKESCSTPEHRELRRQQALKQLEDPEYRKKRAEDAKRGWKKGKREGVERHNEKQKNDEEHKKKQSEHARNAWKDPEKREKRILAIREALRKKRENNG